MNDYINIGGNIVPRLSDCDKLAERVRVLEEQINVVQREAFMDAIYWRENQDHWVSGTSISPRERAYIEALRRYPAKPDAALSESSTKMEEEK